MMRDRLKGKIARLGYQYSKLIDDKAIKERWHFEDNKEKWFYMADQILNIDIIKQAIEDAEGKDNEEN